MRLFPPQRLFTAINFDGRLKEELAARCRELKKYTEKGSFTERNNFHMTLVFIGECDKRQADSVIAAAEKSAREIKKAYAGKTDGAVKIEIGGLGAFPRAGEDLIWAGLNSNPKSIFADLHRRLTENLAPLAPDKRFVQHITLARRVIFRDINQDVTKMRFEPIHTEVKSLVVMESVNMGRIYTPIYEVEFV